MKPNSRVTGNRKLGRSSFFWYQINCFSPLAASRPRLPPPSDFLLFLQADMLTLASLFLQMTLISFVISILTPNYLPASRQGEYFAEKLKKNRFFFRKML